MEDKMKQLAIGLLAIGLIFLALTSCAGVESFRSDFTRPNLQEVVENLNNEFGRPHSKSIDYYITGDGGMGIERWFYKGDGVTHIVNIINGGLYSVETIHK